MADTENVRLFLKALDFPSPVYCIYTTIEVADQLKQEMSRLKTGSHLIEFLKLLITVIKFFIKKK